MKKGDLTTPILMWFVGIVIAILLVTWYVKYSGISNSGIERLDEDLKNIHFDLTLACNHDGLISDVHPNTRTGKLIFNETLVCIAKPLPQGNITRCLPTPCNIGTTGDIKIGEIDIIRINKTTEGVFTITGI